MLSGAERSNHQGAVCPALRRGIVRFSQDDRQVASAEATRRVATRRFSPPPTCEIAVFAFRFFSSTSKHPFFPPIHEIYH